MVFLMIGWSDDRLDGRLLNVGQHLEDDFAAALDHSKDRRLLFFQGAATAFAFQAPPAPLTTFFWTAVGLPL